MSLSLKKTRVALQRHSVVWLLIIAALALRLLYPDYNPPGFHQDEAMNGYTAYSIARTGCDIQGFCGSSLLHGFGESDRRGVLYPYLAIPAIKLFGLSEFTTRLPALVTNTLLLLVLYFLVLRLTNWRAAALMTVFLLILNPLHFHFSRLAHEATISPLLYFLGIYLLLSGLKGKPGRIVWSAIPFALSLYAYQIALVLTPLVLLVTVSAYGKELLPKWRYATRASVLFVILISPYVHEKLLTPGGITLYERNKTVLLNPNPALARNVVSYLDPDFLFFGTSAYIHQGAKKTGVLQTTTIPLIILALPGLILLWQRYPQHRPAVAYLVALGGVMIFTASTVNPSPDPLKVYSLFPVLFMLVSLGLLALGRELSPGRRAGSVAVWTLLLVLELWHASIFLPQYFFKTPQSAENDYKEGMQEMVAVVKESADGADLVLVTTQANQPFIYMLFYLAYPPEQFIYTKKNWDMGKFGHLYSFGKFAFVPDTLMKIIKGPYLYVSRLALPEKQLIDTIRARRGAPLFYIYRDYE
jgi:4-amino-4-deoxy-L-arabinose transferase-like glycosyltransferase